MATKKNTDEIRSLYAAALFWDAIETAAMVEATDGELPDADWDQAEGLAIEAKRRLAEAITGYPRISAAGAERLVFSANWTHEVEERIPGLEGLSTTGTYADLTGRRA